MSSSAPQQQQQLLQKNVFTAYLQPLLSKHERQKIITYEDLTASWQAAMAALSQGKQQHKEHVPAVVSAFVANCSICIAFIAISGMWLCAASLDR